MLACVRYILARRFLSNCELSLERSRLVRGWRIGFPMLIGSRHHTSLQVLTRKDGLWWQRFAAESCLQASGDRQVTLSGPKTRVRGRALYMTFNLFPKPHTGEGSNPETIILRCSGTKYILVCPILQSSLFFPPNAGYPEKFSARKSGIAMLASCTFAEACLIRASATAYLSAGLRS